MEQSNIDTQAAEPTRAAFTIEPAAIASAAAFLAKRVIERRNCTPIAAHVLICADPAGCVTMTGTDLDHWAAVTLAADVESPGTVCVEAGPLADALAKLAKGKAGHIRFASEGQEAHFPARTIERVILTAGTGGAAFTLKTLPADDFPLTPISEAGEALPGFTVPAARFLADLAALAPCMSTSEARYYLQGVSIQARDLAGRDRLLLAATDGANMALASRPIPAGAESLPDLILHRKAVAMLPHAAKIAGAADALALAYDARKFSGGMIRLDLGAVTIWTKAIDGTFPDIARPFAEQLAPTGDDAGPMFPELVAGTPLASMAKIEKAAGQPIEWQDAAQGKLGVAPGDDGLLFACMNVVAANEPVKGFTYGYDHDRERAFTYLRGLAETRNGPIPFAWQSNSLQVQDEQAVGATFGERTWTKGEYVERHNWETLVVEKVYIEPREVWADGSYSVVMPREDRRPLQANVTLEIEGDATVYPLAQNRAGAIHLNAEQVRRIAGDSCFETLALTIAGRVVYILQWLFAQGDSRFMTVRADGRCFTGKQRDQVQFLARDQVEAALRGETVEAVTEPEASAPAMPEICQPEAAGSDCAPDMAQEGGEAPGALHGPESGPVELVSETCELPADPLADLAARVAALEARIAALPADTGQEYDQRKDATWRPASNGAGKHHWGAARFGGREWAENEGGRIIRVASFEAAQRLADRMNEAATPSGEVARPKRTAAHERAIRRAWAERKAARAAWGQVQLRSDFHQLAERGKAFYRDLMENERRKREASTRRAWAARIEARRQRAIAADHMRMREQVQEALRTASAERDKALSALAVEQQVAGEAMRMAETIARRGNQHATRRRASASRARRLLTGTRKAATFQRQRADVLAAQLDKLRSDMADPSQPERASDLAQLVRERDQARTALAATDARNRAMKAALDDLADKFEAMGSRLAVAEAAMRRAG